MALQATNPMPEKPLESDCCGQGCTPCVKDIYEADLARWKKNLQEPETDDRTDDEMTDSDYILCELISVTVLTNDTNVYGFSLPKFKRLTIVGPAHHLILRQTTDSGKSFFTRQYTIYKHDYRCFEVMIKVYPEGRMSKFVKDWKIGDQIPWRGPLGTFRYTPGSFKRIVAFAVGTGLAPILSVVKTLLKDEDDETLLDLQLGFRDFQNILLLNDLRSISDFWNVKITLHLSRELSKPRCRFAKVVLDKSVKTLSKMLLYPPRI